MHFLAAFHLCTGIFNQIMITSHIRLWLPASSAEQNLVTQGHPSCKIVLMAALYSIF